MFGLFFGKRKKQEPIKEVSADVKNYYNRYVTKFCMEHEFDQQFWSRLNEDDRDFYYNYMNCGKIRCDYSESYIDDYYVPAVPDGARDLSEIWNFIKYNYPSEKTRQGIKVGNNLIGIFLYRIRDDGIATHLDDSVWKYLVCVSRNQDWIIDVDFKYNYDYEHRNDEDERF